MKAVNLLPANRQTTRKASPGLDSGRKNALIASGVAGALVLVGLIVMVWSSNSSIGDKRKQLEALQSQIASTSSSSSLAASMGSRRGLVTTLAGSRLAWDQFLNTLSKVMPEDVWLQNLNATTPGAAATLASAQAAAAAAVSAASAATSSGTKSTTTTTPPTPAPAAPAATASAFTVTGYTYSQPSVARMMRRLAIVPWLTGVALVSSSKSTIGSDTVFQFTVKASVVSQPASA